MKPLTLLPPLIFAGLAAMFLFGMNREDADALPSTREGGVVPPLTVTAMPAPFEGFDEADLKAPGVKLVNFWASWCAPCRAEHPQLLAMQAEGLPIYGVNYKDEPARGSAFLDELGDPFAAVVSDEAGRTGLDWGLYGVPETFIIDGEGKVVKRFAGPITPDILEKVIRPAIESASGN